MSGDMKTRILLGAIMIACVAGLLWLDWHVERTGAIELQRPAGGKAVLRALPVAAVMLVLLAPAVWEIVRLCGAAGILILGFSAVVGTSALATLPFWWQFVGVPFAGEALLVLLGAVVCLAFAEQMVRSRMAAALPTVAMTLFTVLYLGVGGAMMLQIRMLEPDGLVRLVLFLATVKCADIGAYFTGSAIGRHKMIPWLSPGKSWEGLAGGLAAAVGASLLINRLTSAGLGVGETVVFGLVVAVAGQFGDLCESLLKRSVHVKDSGSAVPEYGGVLDVIDSPLIAALPAYVLLTVM